jgi:hypothetical protein
MTIDTLRYVEELERAKVPKAQARAHAKAIKDHILPELATKHDLEKLFNRMLISNLIIAGLIVGTLSIILR